MFSSYVSFSKIPNQLIKSSYWITEMITKSNYAHDQSIFFSSSLLIILYYTGVWASLYILQCMQKDAILNPNLTTKVLFFFSIFGWLSLHNPTNGLLIK